MPDRKIFPSGPRLSRSGFTLIELLVVIAIIGILTGLLLPAINAAREAGRRSNCASNIGQIGKAIQAYEAANRSFPPGRMGCDKFSGTPCNNMQPNQTTGTSAFLALLPQLDNTPLYSSFGTLINGAVYPASSSTNWTTPAILTALTIRPSVFVCPSDGSGAINEILTPQTTSCSYALVLGSLGANANEQQQKYYNNGPFVYMLTHRSGDVHDGLSVTIFVGESTQNNSALSMNSWPVSVAYLSGLRSTFNPLNTQPGSGTATLISISNSGLPTDGESVTGGFASSHPAGGNFAFGDGHVFYISDLIDFPTYQALSTINGGEAINDALLNGAGH